MTLPTPAFLADGGPSEALGVNAGLDFGAVLLPCLGSILPEVLHIHNSRRPSEFLAALCNGGQVGKEVLGSSRFFGNNYSHVNGKALDPCCQIWDFPTCLHQVCCLHHQYLANEGFLHSPCAPFCWRQFCKVHVVTRLDPLHPLPGKCLEPFSSSHG